MWQKVYPIVIVITVLVIPFAYAMYLYPGLPEIIPTHFNIKGEADGYGSKGTIFLLPSIMGVVGFMVYLLLTNIKFIDPKRYQEVDDRVFKNFAIGMVVFLSSLSIAILYMIVHPGVPFEKILFTLMGSGFVFMGSYFPKVKQNYFLGLRLPWTLENQQNWNATHKLAGRIWIYGGIIQILFAWILSGVAVIVLFFVVMLVMVLVPTIYSYRMFKKGNPNF